MPKSEQEWLEASNEVSDNLFDLNEKIRKYFTPRDPRLVERYTDSQIGIVLIFQYGNTEFSAFFQRDEGLKELSGKHRDSLFALGCCTCEQIRRTGNQQAVFVHIVEGMELPERFIPTFVWFEPSYLVDDLLPHTLYFSGGFGSVFRGTLGYGERVRTRCSTCGKYQLTRQIIESRPKILQCIPDQKGHIDRDIPNVGDLIDDLSSLRIILGDTFARATFVEVPHHTFKFLDMLFGPLDFWPDRRYSVGHEISVLREVKGYLPRNYTIPPNEYAAMEIYFCQHWRVWLFQDDILNL